MDLTKLTDEQIEVVEYVTMAEKNGILYYNETADMYYDALADIFIGSNEMRNFLDFADENQGWYTDLCDINRERSE